MSRERDSVLANPKLEHHLKMRFTYCGVMKYIPFPLQQYNFFPNFFLKKIHTKSG